MPVHLRNDEGAGQKEEVIIVIMGFCFSIMLFPALRAWIQRPASLTIKTNTQTEGLVIMGFCFSIMLFPALRAQSTESSVQPP
jgi:ABC-type phosphate transport system permease subunit